VRDIQNPAVRVLVQSIFQNMIDKLRSMPAAQNLEIDSYASPE
jgi:hypothetical protein